MSLSAPFEAPRILLAGATGLVGRLLADRLVGAGVAVEALVRRPTGRAAPNWREHVAPPEQWPELVRDCGAEVAISTLGTTMRIAGSRAAFRAVDFDLITAFARAAREGGARRMIAVSSVGADPASRNFYLRTKGETEAALTALGFERLDLVRPGLLRGERGPDRRLGERIGIALSPLVNLILRGPLDRYAAIEAGVVAEAIAGLVQETETGRFMHQNHDLRQSLRKTRKTCIGNS